MEKNPLSVGVRKGIWTPEEDILLKKCVQNYGEGKWHLVPLRAGLNRCRKSCRLRWLNYLKPNIKRGQFSKDEVDLIIRLHKLLGNRWALIAGRLPGRTANDVKNFWNTHGDKKLGEPIAGRVNALKPITMRPQPRTFSHMDICPSQETGQAGTSQPTENDGSKNKAEVPSSSSHECIRWWSNLLEMSTNHDTGTGSNMLVDPRGGGGGVDDDLADFTIGIDIGQLMCFEDDP